MIGQPTFHRGAQPLPKSPAFASIENMDAISAIGTVGTIVFGVLSLYQWNALTAMKRAIRAHAQTSYNTLWSVGNEMEQALKNTTLDSETMRRCSAANATSMAARHEVINFGREYAAFAPKYEQGWNPDHLTK